jgi:hypothetical protein
MSRPLKGKEPRKIVCIRLDPDEKNLLIKEFGGVQAAMDFLIKKLKKKKP